MGPMSDEQHAPGDAPPQPDPERGPGQEGPPGSERPAEQRLTRNRRHKVVGGVCGGLGRYFDMDPVIFRVALAVLSVVGGLGLIFYGLAWLVMPAERERENEIRRLLSGRVEGTGLSALLVALVGCGLFLAALGDRSTPFSVLLIGAVIGAAYWSRHRRRAQAAEAEGAPVDAATAQAVADAPPETQAPPAPVTPSWWRDPPTKNGAGPQPVRDTGYLWGPEEGGTPPVAPGRAARQPWGAAAAGYRPRRGGRPLGGPVFLLACAAAVTGSWLTWPTQSLSTSLVTGLGCALAVFGLGLTVSAFAGRTGGGTVVAAVLTAGLLAGAAVLPPDVSTHWQTREWQPASAEALHDEYRLGTGRGVLDLRRLDLAKGRTISVRAEVGAGQLRVVLPDDVRARVRYDVGLGGFRLPDGQGTTSGEGPGRQGIRVVQPADGDAPQGTVRLQVHVGLGQAVVQQRPALEEKGAAR
jgi:phage shock protein PspC (stress-responsive transcriptional regulator)